MQFNLNELVIARIIAHRYGFDALTADRIAHDMIEDDFPRNGIQTVGQAIAYLNDIDRLDRVVEQS